METSTYKTSMIFVSTGRRTRVFHSMDDVPAPLREKLHANISGPNSRTLIVADRRGREYLVRALKHATRRAAVARRAARPAVHAKSFKGRWVEAKRYWLEIVLIGLLGVASWTLFHWK